MVVGQVCIKDTKKDPMEAVQERSEGLDLEWAWERHEKWRLRTHIGGRADDELKFRK